VSALVARLPAWLSPRDADQTPRRLWRLETVILAALGIFLATATLNDLVWTVHSDGRLVADRATWRQYTHRDYYNVSSAPLVVGQPLDLACANSSPGPPGERTQICILIRGPIHDGLRAVVGGFMLPAREGDFEQYRYDCSGVAVQMRLCPK
jgi:hypothetical protein